jgi:virginiamycin A acetyltransferase
MHPNPNTLFPIPSSERTCFLKNIIKNPNIIVGDYTYYDDPEDIHNFEKNVLYHFDFIGDQLIIGKFCQIAAGVRFIMNGGNHYLGGYSSFPFIIFKSAWPHVPFSPNSKGDTVIGNDVWFGNSVTIMPGIKIGDGAIIGTNSVVTKDVEPYSIIGGNPAQLIRKRFDDITIDFLLDLKWWDWPIETIAKNVLHIMNADQDSLSKVNIEVS